MRPGLACWLAIVAVLLAGCGGGKKSLPDNGVSSMTAQQILVQMEKAVGNATSVHVTGGGGTESSAISLDLQLVAGKGGAGHVESGGFSFDLVKTGGKLYVKADKAFLTKYAGKAAPLLEGKWFVVTAKTADFTTFTSFTDLVQLTNGIVSSAGTVTKGSTSKIDGQPAIGITSSKGGTLYVATTGPAYPLELQPATGSGGIKFTDWDEPVTLTAPPNPVDYAKVTGRH